MDELIQEGIQFIPVKVKTQSGLLFSTWDGCYLPMQKRLKMLSRSSSGATGDVISPR
jgi:hypothetical protein